MVQNDTKHTVLIIHSLASINKARGDNCCLKNFQHPVHVVFVIYYFAGNTFFQKDIKRVSQTSIVFIYLGWNTEYNIDCFIQFVCHHLGDKQTLKSHDT